MPTLKSKSHPGATDAPSNCHTDERPMTMETEISALRDTNVVKPRRRRWFQVSAGAIFLMVGGAGAAYNWSAISANAEGSAPPLIAKSAGKLAAGPSAPVRVAIVGIRDFPFLIPGLGTVQPLNTVTVRSRVDGQVEVILFKVTHGLVFGGIGLDLRAVECDVPEPHEAGPHAQLQHLQKQRAERFQAPEARRDLPRLPSPLPLALAASATP